MSTYHGITKISCRNCDWSSTDDRIMEAVNDDDLPCGRCESNSWTFEYADGSSENVGCDAFVAVKCVACNHLVTDPDVMRHMLNTATVCPVCGDGALMWDDGSLGYASAPNA